MAEKAAYAEIAVVDRDTIFRGDAHDLALLAVHLHLALG